VTVMAETNVNLVLPSSAANGKVMFWFERSAGVLTRST